MKEKIKTRVNRILVEKKYLESKNPKEGAKYVLRSGVRDVIKYGCGKENIDPNFIKSELEAMDNVIDGDQSGEFEISYQATGNNKTINELVEEKGFVQIW